MLHSSGRLRIELPGPVEARVDGRAVALGGQRRGALFPLLALMGGRVPRWVGEAGGAPHEVLD
jgi:hypothetical protein